MDITLIRTPGLGDQSYVLTHDGQAIVIDPQRDIDRFTQVVDASGAELTHVLETHLHNDYVSGGPALAEQTDATLVMPAAAAPAYRHLAAYHHEDIDTGGLIIRPIHTPGHTPEHTSYLIVINGTPTAVFSGGSLLVGSAGRTDLLGAERADTLARLQWHSLKRLTALPHDVEVLPTHGDGSFCSVSGSPSHTSTVKEELASNSLAAIDTPDAFVEKLLDSAMPIPSYYKHMGPANLTGMPAMTLPDLPAHDASTLDADVRRVVIDARPRQSQADGHLKGAFTIELSDDFGSWAAWLTPPDAPLVLVTKDAADLREARTHLARVGRDNVVATLEAETLPAERAATFTLLELDDFVADLESDAQLLDVRMQSEVDDDPLPPAVHRFLPDLIEHGPPAELDQSGAVHVVCGSGRRASIAAGYLAGLGFEVRVLTDAGASDVAEQLDAN